MNFRSLPSKLRRKLRLLQCPIRFRARSIDSSYILIVLLRRIRVIPLLQPRVTRTEFAPLSPLFCLIQLDNPGSSRSLLSLRLPILDPLAHWTDTSMAASHILLHLRHTTLRCRLNWGERSQMCRNRNILSVCS